MFRKFIGSVGQCRTVAEPVWAGAVVTRPLPVRTRQMRPALAAAHERVVAREDLVIAEATRRLLD